VAFFGSIEVSGGRNILANSFLEMFTKLATKALDS
jgi:hypothetical protein